MATQTISYDDKVSIETNPLPEVNKCTASNLNEIKSVVNNNAGELDTTNSNVTDLQTNKLNASAVKNAHSTETDEVYSANYINSLFTVTQQSPTFVDEYVNSGYINYYVLGNIVIVTLDTVRFKKDVPANTVFVTGLPTGGSSPTVVGFQSSQNTMQQPVRLKIENGNLKTHYSTAKYYSDTNVGLYATIIYKK